MINFFKRLFKIDNSKLPVSTDGFLAYKHGHSLENNPYSEKDNMLDYGRWRSEWLWMNGFNQGKKR